jgi:hypothetical protein
VEQREPDPAAEPVVAPPEDVPAESAEPGRRYPSTIGGAVYLLVLVSSGVGLWIVGRGDWRPGVRTIAVSLLVAAAVRLVLPARDAGMLAVRRRVLDVALLAVVGVTLLALSSSIPNQPPL